MNKHNDPSQQLDVDAVIDSFSKQFGDDADKVLTKITMSPSNYAKEMGLKDENGTYLCSPYEIIQRMANTETNHPEMSRQDNQQQDRQILALVANRKANTL